MQRADRALREFRIRGVKTNIAFLLNLIGHPTFKSGEATTTFIDDTPELFRFRAPRDRATKMLSYLGDVIVNGRPDVKGTFDPQRKLPTAGRAGRVDAATPPPPGTRQKLQELGPGAVRRVDPRASGGCSSPTRRCAMRISRCWRRASAPTTCWRSPTRSRG